MDESDDAPRTYASPPCFMHELDPAYGLPSTDPRQAADVARWRKGERERLIAERLATSSAARASVSERIIRRLEELLGDPAGLVIAAYWPFRGEPNLHPWMRRVSAQGARVALPVVVEKAKPLEFRAWVPGAKLAKGVWNIPFPADGEIVLPDVVIAPLVGFDEARFRLGYGGGYYDRTLAAMPTMPRVVGVGYESARLKTIYPQWHDIAMHELLVE